MSKDKKVYHYSGPGDGTACNIRKGLVLVTISPALVNCKNCIKAMNRK